MSVCFKKYCFKKVLANAIGEGKGSLNIRKQQNIFHDTILCQKPVELTE